MESLKLIRHTISLGDVSDNTIITAIKDIIQKENFFLSFLES